MPFKIPRFTQQIWPEMAANAAELRQADGGKWNGWEDPGGYLVLLALPGTPPNATKTMEFLVGIEDRSTPPPNAGDEPATSRSRLSQEGVAGWVMTRGDGDGGLNNSSAASPSPPLEPMTGGAGQRWARLI